MAQTSVKPAREVAFELFSQGLRPSDEEVKALGIKSKTTYNYFQDWKRGQVTISGAKAGTTSVTEKGSNTQAQKVVGTAIELGKITVSPENWGGPARGDNHF